MRDMRKIVNRNTVSTWTENCLGLGYGHKREWLSALSPGQDRAQSRAGKPVHNTRE